MLHIETENGSHSLSCCLCKICMFFLQLGLHEVCDIYQFLYVEGGNLGATLLLQILNVLSDASMVREPSKT